MKFKVGLLVLLTTTLRCEGHLSLLGGLLSTAHEQIHSNVQDVAGTILSGIDKGLNFNFESHVEVNRQRPQGYGYRPPQPQQEYRPENNPYENNYGQGHHGYNPNQNGSQRPINNNQNPYSPNYNGYNRPVQNENQNFNHQHGNENERYPNSNPNHHNNHNNYQQYPNNGNYGHNNKVHPSNQYYNNYPNNRPSNQNQGYPNNHNYPNNNEYNNQNNVNEPNFGNEPENGNPPNKEHDVTQGQTYPSIISTTSQIPEFSTTTTLHTTEVNKSYEDDKATQKPTDDDVPLFIPLGPNDYVYNGDKINVTDPKRHAEKKPQPAEEENFPIDVRFKDE